MDLDCGYIILKPPVRWSVLIMGAILSSYDCDLQRFKEQQIEKVLHALQNSLHAISYDDTLSWDRAGEHSIMLNDIITLKILCIVTKCSTMDEVFRIVDDCERELALYTRLITVKGSPLMLASGAPMVLVQTVGVPSRHVEPHTDATGITMYFGANIQARLS